MANNLDTIMPKILARGLGVLRERCIMPRVVNGSYSQEAAQKGATIDIPIPTAVGIRDVTPGPTKPSNVDNEMDLVQVQLNHWKQNDPIHLTDKEMIEINRTAHFLPAKLEEAVKSLAREVNRTIHAEYKGIYGAYGTPGTTPFGSGVGVKTCTNAMRILNEQLCPQDPRWAVMDFTAQAAAAELPTFNEADKRGSREVQLTGELGVAFGIDWVADDGVLTHTAGTISNGADREAQVNNLAGYAAGVDTVNIDSTTLTGTIVVGDIIRFDGHDQTYVVVANTSSTNYNAATETYTAGSNAITGLKFYPPLKEAVVDNEVVTVEDTHVVNLAFHRDAFAFATRPLQQENGFLEDLGGKMMTMQDPKTNLVLRLEVSRQHKQVTWEFDLLWGAKLVRPQLAMRLFG